MPTVDARVSNHWVTVPTPVTDRWLIFLTGIAIIDFPGSGADWRRDHYQVRVPLDQALAATGRRPRPDHDLAFFMEMWAPFVTVNARSNAQTAVNDGSAVDAFWVSNGRQQATVAHLEVDVAVREADAAVHRLGFQLTTTGYLVEVPFQTPG